MIMSNKKYLDPNFVLKSLCDDFGNRIQIGEQKDIGEFNLNFIERVEEGLGEKVSDEEKLEEEKKSVELHASQTYARQSSLSLDVYNFPGEAPKVSQTIKSSSKFTNSI